MIAKAGLGLIGLSAISVGGVALTKPSWLGMGDSMPDCHLLFEDSDYDNKKSNEYGTGKFGGKYKSYLVGVTTKKNGNNKTNEGWWKWSFRRLEKDNGSNSKPGAKFANAKNYGTGSDTNAINKICEAAYKADQTSSIDTEGSGDKYKEADIWKYCSVLGGKPTTVGSNQTENSSYKDGDLGKTQNSKLISILDKNNDKFWEIRNKEFKGDPGYEKIENTVDSFFNPASGTIKELCEKAYKTRGTESSTPDSNKVIKYCSLDKQ